MAASVVPDFRWAEAPSSSGGIVIVGGGLAGLFCALKLAPLPVTLITAAPLGEGASSAWAQGGIAAAIGEGDTPAAHAADTLAAGAGIVDPEIAHLIAREAPARIDDLLRYGVPFDRDLEGKLALSQEAAHHARRIVRVRGDLAGKAIIATLISAVRATPSIRVVENATLEELVTRDGRVGGIRLRRNGRRSFLPARIVVLATGGAGHLFAVTTNPIEAHGDGLAAAARAGAVVADTEFVQFHPTAIDIGRDPAPLATEALRGEGSILVNSRGERFMLPLHPDAELAPRDIVARGVFSEIAAGRGAFLDASKALGSRFAEHFPTVHATCLSAGIDPAVQPIPVAPAAHYHMGGVATDTQGRTTLPGLWAAGEVASTGAHGANRLASNSLLEAVVFAARIAEDISGLSGGPATSAAPEDIGAVAPSADPREVRELRELMSRDVGVVRRAEGLRRALRRFRAFESSSLAPELRNRATASLLVAAASLARTESRGAQARADCPDADPALAHRSFLTLDTARALADAQAPAELCPAE